MANIKRYHVNEANAWSEVVEAEILCFEFLCRKCWTIC